MYYVVCGKKVVWSGHYKLHNAETAARRLAKKWSLKGYRFRAVKINGRWDKGDNPSACYYC